MALTLLFSIVTSSCASEIEPFADFVKSSLSSVSAFVSDSSETLLNLTVPVSALDVKVMLFV